MSPFLRKYNTAATLDGIPLVTYGLGDYKSSPTLADGDVKISKDGGSLNNITSLPTASGLLVQIALSATETTAARVVIQFVDQTSPKEWEDQIIIVETYGNASAQHAMDFGTATIVASSVTGLTASDVGAIKTKTDFLPSATAGAAGGVFIAGTNAATTVTTAFTTTFTGSLTGSVGSVSGAVGSVTGNVGGNVTGSVGSVVGAVGSVTGNVGGNVTGSVGSVVGAVGSVTGLTASDVSAIKTKTDFLPSATAGAAGGVFIAGTNAATTITTALTTTFTGNLTGNVGGNVTGSVASVVGAVGSVTGLTASDVGAIKTKTDYLPSATAGAAGGVFIAGTNAATTITSSLTTTFTGNLTGNVGGNVTGNVGGNVVGNVLGSVDSVVDPVTVSSSGGLVQGKIMAEYDIDDTTLGIGFWIESDGELVDDSNWTVTDAELRILSTNAVASDFASTSFPLSPGTNGIYKFSDTALTLTRNTAYYVKVTYQYMSDPEIEAIGGIFRL